MDYTIGKTGPLQQQIAPLFKRRMAQTVKMNLRVPSPHIRRPDTDALETIDDSDGPIQQARLRSESIPKPR